MHLDFPSGVITPSEHRSTRRLRDVHAIFADQSAAEAMDPDTTVYETYGCPGDAPGERLLYGTTVLMPGQVGAEHFMTRGHFHTKPERGELCLTLSGQGVLLLMPGTRANGQIVAHPDQTRQEAMTPGSIHNIDGQDAHRVVNTGDVPLIFFVSWLSDCGHDYESIRETGFGIRL